METRSVSKKFPKILAHIDISTKLYDRSIVPKDVKDAVNKAIADMKAGKVTAPVTRKQANYAG